MESDRSETVIVRGGDGRLALLRGALDTALVYEGVPVALAWCSPEVRGARDFVRAHDLEDVELSLSFRDVPDSSSLSDLLRPLFELVDDGPYRVELTATPDVAASHEDEDRPAASGRIIDWAGLHSVRSEDGLLIGTVPRDLLDRGQIRMFVDQIRAGARPPVIVLQDEEADLGFLVAGHTALEAYRMLGMPPTLLHVTPLEPAALAPGQGADLLERAYDHIRDLVTAHYEAVHSVASDTAAG